MKQLIYTTLLIVLIVSCGEKQQKGSIEQMIAKGNVQGLKQKQATLQEEYNRVTAQLAQIREGLARFDKNKQLPIVTTFRVKDTIFEHKIEVQGSVDTKNNTMLFSEFSGVLTHLYVKKGQRVAKGQLVAKVDDGGLSQQLGQAQVQYELAKTTFERQARLWEKNIGSEIQYLQAKANMEATQRSVNQINAQLGKTTVRAPFSGIIDDVPVKEGAVILPGQTPIARLVNLRDMYVRSDLSESYLGKINVGTPVEIIFSAIGKKLKSKVRQTGNFINPNNRTFYIEIGIPNKGNIIKPNLMATLIMADYRNENALVVPENIIQEDSEGNSYVYTLEEKNGKQTAHKIYVEKGFSQGAFVEIKQGLQTGMVVVDEGSQGMQEGLIVEVK